MIGLGRSCGSLTDASLESGSILVGAWLDSPASSRPFQDQRGRPGNRIGNIVSMTAIGYLTRAGLAPQLTHRFCLCIPTLHVRLGDHSTRRVHRKFAAGPDSHRLDEIGGLAFFAVTIILQDVE